ncbi:MAG: hypothetical protein IJH07_10380 [Ruminococcus sp.]|nr:hypothetical protein [Ruminococcus sp.]
MSNYTPKHPSSGASRAKQSDGDKKKQKVLIIVILAVLAIIIAAALIFIFVPGAESGVGKLFGGSGGYVPETQDGTTIISPYYENGILPTSGERHDIEIIYGGGTNADELLGTWDLDGNTIYKFDGQGRGIMLTGVDNYTFIYSAQNGKLGIDMDSDGSVDREYSYTITGDKLTLDGAGYHFEFSKTTDDVQ